MLRTRKRIGAALLAAGLVFSQLGATAYAVESPAGTGLCEHHTAHDAAVCGYVEAIPGRDCEHEHTPECYTDELICGMDEDAEQTATDSDAGHTHGQACYALDCSHERGEHTTDCGYIEAVPGTPCGYVCEVCAGEPDKDSGKEEPTISGNGLTAPEKTGTETGEPGDTGTITVTAFDGIPDAVKQQTVQDNSVVFAVFPAYVDAPAGHILYHFLVHHPAQIALGKIPVAHTLHHTAITQGHRLPSVLRPVPLPQRKMGGEPHRIAAGPAPGCVVLDVDIPKDACLRAHLHGPAQPFLKRQMVFLPRRGAKQQGQLQGGGDLLQQRPVHAVKPGALLILIEHHQQRHRGMPLLHHFVQRQGTILPAAVGHDKLHSTGSCPP